MWASYSNGKPDYGTRCNGNSPAKTVIADGVMYSLYSNQNYIYTYEYHTCSTAWSSNYAVAVYAQQYDTRSELTIKSTIQDGNTTYTVVAIGEQFFWYNKSATKLTIPATVQTLEAFALEDNTSNLREIVIEDSGDKLECYRTTESYGAFSWNSGLKKVYIGRQLYTVGGSDYNSYAPFYKGDFTDLEVTFGPLVDYIYGYTFYNNSIKSIKAIPTLPPNWAAYAFGGVSSNIPVYVSYKTIDAYKAHLDWKYFTNYVLDTDLCKADALNDLDAEAGENPSATVQGVVSDYKNKVNAATSGADVVTNLNAGKLAIQLQKAKDIAIAALNAEAGAPSQTVANVRDTWIANVNKATTVDDVNTCKSNGIAAIQLQKAKDAAIAALNTEAGNAPSQTVANVRDTWIAKVNNATTVDDVNTQKEKGIAAVQLQKAKDSAITALTEAKVANPSGAADDIFNEYKASINAATSIDEVTAVKEEGIQKLQEYFVALEDEKASAKAELDAAKSQYPSEYADNIVNNCKTEIEAATTIEAVKAAKDEGIKNLQLEYNNLQDLKNKAIAELDNAKKDYPSAHASSIVAEGKNAIENAKSQSEVIKKKEHYIAQLMTAFKAELTNAKNDAINALNQAKDEYPSDAAEGIVSKYTDKINAATSIGAINAAKEEGVQALKDANELQDAKMTAIAALNEAKITYPSDAADGIASTYTGKINAATTKDAITAAKKEGIQALKDAYNAQKEAERLAALDAVTVTQTAEDDYSYMLEDGVRFEFDGDNVNMTVDGKDEAGFTLSETVAIKICPARTFKIKANQDPDNTSDYYSTFYTSEGAYKVPSEAKAYAGTVESGEETDVLKLTDVGKIIHQSEAVILKASQSDITLMPSCNKADASAQNILEGTDEEKTLGTYQYALSLGQNGVGFYLWEGKAIGANKAYLIWDGSEAGAKAFTFKFDDGEVDAIHSINVNDSSTGSETGDNLYNLNGLRVGKDYKGIVIVNGKKVIK